MAPIYSSKLLKVIFSAFLWPWPNKCPHRFLYETLRRTDYDNSFTLIDSFTVEKSFLFAIHYSAQLPTLHDLHSMYRSPVPFSIYFEVPSWLIRKGKTDNNHILHNLFIFVLIHAPASVAYLQHSSHCSSPHTLNAFHSQIICELLNVKITATIRILDSFSCINNFINSHKTAENYLVG